MGIRCYCPNGHKLNVKAEQAGMVGICPKCGARFQIPFESTRPSSHKDEPASSAEETAPSDRNPDSPADQSDPSRPASHESVTAASAAGPAQAKAPIDTELQDDHTESWYIQGGDNREYGPVTLEVIRSWIAEHRVAAATLVWKKGWPDWKEARLVFSEFSASPPPPPAAENAVRSADPPLDEIDALRQAAQNSRETSIQKKSRLAKKQKSRRDLYIVISLVATILILAGVLVFILLHNSGKSETPAPPPAPVSAVELPDAPDGFLQS